MDDDNISDYGGEEEEYGEEFGMFDRVQLATHELLTGEGNRNTRTPAQKFAIVLDAIWRSIGDEGAVSKKDLHYMLDQLKYVKKVEFKNPSAYMLGYIASAGGKDITEQNFKRAEKLLGYITDKTVKNTDIVRYARYWKIHLSNI